MLIDVHVHSNFSFDSQEEIGNYIDEARLLDIPVIGFSEHYDYDAFLEGADIRLTDLSAYTKCIKKLKKQSSMPDILCGVEFGYSQAAESQYKSIASNDDFDYVINSVHTLPNRGDCYFPAFFTGKTIKEAYSDYFNAILCSLKADYDYQIVGHIGYVSRYCKALGFKINYRDYSEILDEILNEIIRLDKCLEINTSSGNAGSDFLPDKDIIERFLQLGGEKLSFGSDAHRVIDFQRKSDIVLNYLKSIGIKKLFYYKNRIAIPYEI